MRAAVPDYTLVAARDVPEALDLAAAGCRPMAGGTDLMVVFQTGVLAVKKLVSIWKVSELRGIAVTDEYVSIGALATYAEIQRHPVLLREFGMLCTAASWTGSVANQNRGTLGGNIGNASPAADSPPALLVYDAQLELLSVRGSRCVGYSAFHTGYKQTLLAPDELIARILLPRAATPRKEYIRKVGARRAQAISKVCIAGLREGDQLRIAVGSMGPTAIFGTSVDEILARIAPIGDIRSTAQYRRRVTENLLREFMLATA